MPHLRSESADRSGDGLRHFGYQKEQKFYNGMTIEDIHGENKSNRCGVHGGSLLAQERRLADYDEVMAEQGIVGRAVLLDFHRWRVANKIPYEPFKTCAIPLKHLKAVAEAQGTEIKFGDILIIRTGDSTHLLYAHCGPNFEIGYMAAYNALSRDEISALTKNNPPGLGGVEQSEEMLEWIWDHFSAVAGDQPPFERWRESLCFLHILETRMLSVLQQAVMIGAYTKFF